MEEIFPILKEIATVTMGLFWIIDIIGNIPIVVKLQKDVGAINATKSAVVAGLIMIVFLFVGEILLDLMKIQLQAFAVGGALILFIIALEMLLGVEFHKTQIPESVSIIPIAFPLLAGPGVLTVALSMKAAYESYIIIIGIIINMIIVYFGLKFAGIIAKRLGETGVIIVHKIAGIILLALSIKLFAENWKTLLN